MKYHNTPTFKRKTARHFVVRENTTMMDFLLFDAMSDQSRTTVKQILRDRFISVGGHAVTQHDYKLNVGDVVCLNATPMPEGLNHPKIKILWQDEYLIMISKDAGVPTVASGNEKDRTALRIVSDHLKKFDHRAKVFMLNRLDKDSAGLVLMAKTQEIQNDFISHWENYVVKQEFLVAVEGSKLEKDGILAPPEHEDDNNITHTRRHPRINRHNDPFGMEAGRASYKVIKYGDVCSLLFVKLEAGRNNQLRKQFKSLNIPIAGDWRNGSTFKQLGRVALQGVTFSFIHPIDRQERTFRMPENPILGKLARMKSEKEYNFFKK